LKLATKIGYVYRIAIVFSALKLHVCMYMYARTGLRTRLWPKDYWCSWTV